MTITFRMDDELEKAVKTRASSLGTTVSDFVRAAVTEKLEREEAARPKKTPYEGWKEIYTGYASGETDRSTRVNDIVTEAIEEDYRRQVETFKLRP